MKRNCWLSVVRFYGIDFTGSRVKTVHSFTKVTNTTTGHYQADKVESEHGIVDKDDDKVRHGRSSPSGTCVDKFICIAVVL